MSGVMGVLRRVKKLAVIAWRAFARVAETLAQCFIILPWYFLFERAIHDLQSIVARGGSDGGEGEDEEELNVMRLVAHLTLSYFERGEPPNTTSPSPRHTRLRSPRSPTSPFNSPSRGGITWVNELLEQSWGHISESVTENLLSSLNKLLKDKVVSSHAIKRMTLASMSLGSKPPCILWIKVLPKIQAPSQSSPTDPDVEMMHLQVAFDWQSDMHGLLTIVTHMISTVDLQCADVCVKGVMHIILGPLCPSVPPFQRANAYFLKRPKVKLKMRLLSDLLAMNFEVTDTVGRMVKSQLKSFALFPKFIEIPISR